MYERKIFVSLCDELRENGYKFSTLWDSDTKSRVVYLRHDIDFSVDAALNLAQIENELGITSTFFFMCTSEFYNLFSKRTISQVKEIASLGHKISIHFDPDNYDDLKPFSYEMAHFEQQFDTKIDIISIHRPRLFLENNNIDICGIPQTYHDDFTKKMYYISDSAGRDPTPAVAEFINKKSYKALHLLIHPVWWQEKRSSPTETLNIWLRDRMDYLHNETAVNCRTFKINEK